MSDTPDDARSAPRRTRAGAVAVAVVMAGAGLLLSTTAQTARGTQLRSQSADLASLIEVENARQVQRVAELERLREQYERLSAAVSAGGQQERGLRDVVARLAPLAGLTPATGRGLTVTLDDAPRTGAVPAGVSPDDLVVHQQDVQAVVNAMWAGGASAMMLQDQRVISTSAVRCVGNTLILQGRVYSPPYTVTAIGDPARLRAALEASPDVQFYLQYVASLNLRYDLRESPQLRLPAYAGPLTLTHATTTEKPGEKP